MYIQYGARDKFLSSVVGGRTATESVAMQIIKTAVFKLYPEQNYAMQKAVRMKCVEKINPLMGTGNYSATSNNIKLVHWPLMGGLLHLV